MNQQKILIVEIKTIDNVSFDTEQLRKIVVHRDSSNNYFLSTGVEEIKRAIVEAVPRLGNNYRHPLLFHVQIVSGDGTDALIGSTKNLKTRPRKRRNS